MLNIHELINPVRIVSFAKILKVFDNQPFTLALWNVCNHLVAKVVTQEFCSDGFSAIARGRIIRESPGDGEMIATCCLRHQGFDRITFTCFEFNYMGTTGIIP